ncbi:hypothetical protein Pmani_003002 [Petrolisthes manimaculis]|uniref:Uncharacterized protein n=1 Tax=Petrolisthes manimaculis TaxID=1843537 RepID=A0AAE1QGQ0_9EUCA|nr:hypothetical protein Pmani_003002 [Petrolisthes manimaculis]
MTFTRSVIFAAIVAVGFAAPQYSYGTPAEHSDESSEEIEVVPILRDDRVHEEDGTYNLDVETGNGIVLSQSGSPVGPDDSVVKAGEYSYTAPDGTPIHVKFVADENGFQPQSDILPVAPEFPHPIPDFVLEQIRKAAEEDAAAAARGEVNDYSYSESESDEDEAPSYLYSSPQ